MLYDFINNSYATVETSIVISQKLKVETSSDAAVLLVLVSIRDVLHQLIYLNTQSPFEVLLREALGAITLQEKYFTGRNI